MSRNLEGEHMAYGVGLCGRLPVCEAFRAFMRESGVPDAEGAVRVREDMVHEGEVWWGSWALRGQQGVLAALRILYGDATIALRQKHEKAGLCIRELENKPRERMLTMNTVARKFRVTPEEEAAMDEAVVSERFASRSAWLEARIRDYIGEEEWRAVASEGGAAVSERVS